MDTLYNVRCPVPVKSDTERRRVATTLGQQSSVPAGNCSKDASMMLPFHLSPPADDTNAMSNVLDGKLELTCKVLVIKVQTCLVIWPGKDRITVQIRQPVQQEERKLYCNPHATFVTIKKNPFSSTAA